MSWPAPWLISYGLLGLTQSGLVPVLMPLAAADGSTPGLTFAAFSLSGVVAPILGGWADREGRHRDLLVCGTFASGAFLLLFDAVPTSLRIPLAAAAGLGTTAAITAGNVIAIQGLPEDQWDSRVALLQRVVSAGQVIGLIIAGLLAGRHPGGGFTFAGAALIAAGLLAVACYRQLQDRRVRTRGRLLPGEDAAASAPNHHVHGFGWHGLKAYLSVINPPMRRFLLVWLIAYSAMNGFAALFPVAMTREFVMDPILPSGAYAIGVSLSLPLYTFVGAATHRLGGVRIMAAGFGARLAVLGILAAVAWLGYSSAAWLALAGFALIQFVWPLLAVAANSLSVRYLPTARGEGVGLFNATTALASAIGSAAAGAIYDSGGFAALAASTFAAVGVALLLSGLRPPSWPARS
jgi:MFS transporter, DHA1 family, tetracycline resistance protein